MTREQANKLAAEFAGLLPHMTDPQIKQVRDELVKYEHVEAAWGVCQSYAKTHEDFVLKRFVDALAALHPATHTTHATRTQQDLAELRRCAVAIERQWSEVDAVIARLDDQALAAEAEAVLQELPEQIARIERAKGPRNSRLIKGMIAERVAGLAGGDE